MKWSIFIAPTLVVAGLLGGCASADGENLEPAAGEPSDDESDPGSHAESALTAPTFGQIYTKYFAAGTAGHCVNCHNQASSASSFYAFLQGRGQISATTPKSSPIAKSGSSILKWFGGRMPKDAATSTNAAAKRDIKAWVKAGALNN